MDCPGPGLVSNGPFILHKVESQSLIVLQKNVSFWQQEQIRLAGISIYIIPNDMTALEMFERKELDWLGGHLSAIPPDALPSLQERLHYFPIAASTFCTFNTERIPFSNENIRKAFNLATDRVEIAREIFPTNQIFASRYIPPALCDGKNRILFPPFNPRLARDHLTKGLQELNTTITSVTIHYRHGTIDEKLAQILKEMWETTLGLEVKLRQTDGKTHKDCLHKRNYEIALSSWIAQYPDPMNILERFKNRSNAKNYCSWEDPEFTSLLELAKKTMDPLERLSLLEKAEELLADQVPIIPLYHWSNPSLAHSRLHNYQTTPGGGILFERCWLSEEP